MKILGAELEKHPTHPLWLARLGSGVYVQINRQRVGIGEGPRGDGNGFRYKWSSLGRQGFADSMSLAIRDCARELRRVMVVLQVAFRGRGIPRAK